MNNYFREPKQIAAATIEQARRLRKAGLDLSRADMLFRADTEMKEYRLIHIEGGYYPGLFSDRNGYEIPTWSIGMLIQFFNQAHNGPVTLARGRDMTSIRESLVRSIVGDLE